MLPTRTLTAILILTLLTLTACTAPATQLAEAPTEAATAEPTATATVTPTPTITPTPTPAIPFEADFEVRVEIGEDGAPLYFAELDAGEGLRTYQVTPVTADGTLLVLTDEDGVSYIYDQSGELVELVDGKYAVVDGQVIIVNEAGVEFASLGEGVEVVRTRQYSAGLVLETRNAEGQTEHYTVTERGLESIQQAIVLQPNPNSLIDPTEEVVIPIVDNQEEQSELVRQGVMRYLELLNIPDPSEGAVNIYFNGINQQIELIRHVQQHELLHQPVYVSQVQVDSMLADLINDNYETLITPVLNQLANKTLWPDQVIRTPLRMARIVSIQPYLSSRPAMALVGNLGGDNPEHYWVMSMGFDRAFPGGLYVWEMGENGEIHLMGHYTDGNIPDFILGKSAIAITQNNGTHPMGFILLPTP